jgi:sulfur carrier protein
LGPITVVLNGESLEVPPGTVHDLIKLKALDPSLIIVEYNRNILPKDQHSTTQLSHGDSIEFVRYIGGGSIEDFF